MQVDENSKNKMVSVVGHTNMSMTFIPTICPQPISGLTIVDAPGFMDNRGASINIANTVNINCVLFQAKSVRLLVLINWHSLKADRGKGVSDLLFILSDLFGKSDCIEK